ncbi:exosome complex exonuclease RRP43 [Xylariaceae sp. FL0594]|nr:exosome complex exonuclease RRP43 [Xylariaceae sp. FL0594]
MDPTKAKWNFGIRMATSIPQTLSSATFAKLSPHPYLLANLQPSDPSTTPSSRTNGRLPTEARRPAINTSSLSHAHGSAMVRTGDTTVICGVRGETLATSQIPNYRASTHTGTSTSNGETDEIRVYDLLVPNIELATGSAPNLLPGVPPTTLAQTLITRLYSLLHSSGILNAEDLRIYHDKTAVSDENDEDMQDADNEAEEEEDTREVKAYWVLYIDILFVSLDGNPFDAAWAAVLAALRDTKLPKAYWDADREMVVCSRPQRSSSSGGTNTVPLSVRGLPVACTAAVFTAKDRLKQMQMQTQSLGQGRTASESFWILVDPDRFEEGLCDETVTVVVDRSGLGIKGEGEEKETKILSISKSGGTMVGPEVLRRFVKVAEDRWQVFRDIFGS